MYGIAYIPVFAAYLRHAYPGLPMCGCTLESLALQNVGAARQELHFCSDPF